MMFPHVDSNSTYLVMLQTWIKDFNFEEDFQNLEFLNLEMGFLENPSLGMMISCLDYKDIY